MNKSLPLFYFQPTLCWLDDDALFLDAAKLSYESQFHCHTFNNPATAISTLSAYQSPLKDIPFTRELTESDLFGTKEHYPITLNIPAIKSLMTLPDKHHEIAIMVSDFNMPTMNGLDVFKALKNQPFKKILLTGDASQEEAIRAFNDGTIQRFIRKNSAANELLEQYIKELAYEHFQEKTRHIVHHLESSRPSALSDPAFISLFNEWCTRENIVEFYLIHRQGHFMAKNVKGEQLYFVIFSERDKKEFLHLNDEAGEVASHLLDAFAKGERIPFFGEDAESWDIAPNEWENHFYPVNHIKGREPYYWTVVKG